MSVMIDLNGTIREATPEEAADIERMAAETSEIQLTPEERIAQLERDNADLKEALALLLSGEVE